MKRNQTERRSISQACCHFFKKNPGLQEIIRYRFVYPLAEKDVLKANLSDLCHTVMSGLQHHKHPFSLGVITAWAFVLTQQFPCLKLYTTSNVVMDSRNGVA